MTKDYYIMRILKLLGLDPEDEENKAKREELENCSVLKLITLIDEYRDIDSVQSFSRRCGSSF